MDRKGERGVSDTGEVGDFSGVASREGPIPPERILDAVTNEYRRSVLHSLDSATDGTLEYDTLVERVADAVRDENAEEVPDEHRRRVRIALHHTHLPKLEEIRAIDYETETNLVQLVDGELDRSIQTLLESYGVHE